MADFPEQCASQDAIPIEEVKFVAQSDYSGSTMASENRPQKSLDDAFQYARQAIERGAIEIRIRPYPLREQP